MLIAKVQAMLRRTYSFAESTNIIEHNGCIRNLTAQNTTGVTDIMEVSPKFLAEQLDGIFTDIYPDAVKTGMVASGNSR